MSESGGSVPINFYASSSSDEEEEDDDDQNFEHVYQGPTHRVYMQKLSCGIIYAMLSLFIAGLIILISGMDRSVTLSAIVIIIISGAVAAGARIWNLYLQDDAAFPVHE